MNSRERRCSVSHHDIVMVSVQDVVIQEPRRGLNQFFLCSAFHCIAVPVDSRVTARDHMLRELPPLFQPFCRSRSLKPLVVKTSMHLCLRCQVVEHVKVDGRGGKLDGGMGVPYDIFNPLSCNAVNHVDICVREQLIRPLSYPQNL